MTTPGLPYLTADDVHAQVDIDDARMLIERALAGGFDPATDPARTSVHLGEGHLLLMPSGLSETVGVKVASVAPGNPALGLPRIQALYLLLDARTLTLRLLVDGSALTLLRTPATTAVAVDRLAAPDASRLTVFGTGPQAVAHIHALNRIRRIEDITVIGRTQERGADVVRELAEEGLPVRLGEAHDVADADIVLCATSSADPLFDGSLITDGTCVAAMGSHQPDRRELPSDLLERSLVVVEDVATALREAGDVVMSVNEGALTPDNLSTLADLVNNRLTRDPSRPNVFKGTGMSWQDLAIASALEPPKR